MRLDKMGEEFRAFVVGWVQETFNRFKTYRVGR